MIIRILDDKADCLKERLIKKRKKYESTSKKLSDVRGDQEETSKQLTDLSSKTSITQGEIDKQILRGAFKKACSYRIW